MEKFHKIQAGHGLLSDGGIPVDIQSFQGQHQLRHLAWCITEECTEAIRVCRQHQSGGGGLRSLQGEVIDILHFLVEMAISCGVLIDLKSFFHHERLELRVNTHIAETQLFELIYDLGTRVNLEFRNRPWKQTVTPCTGSLLRGLSPLFERFRFICAVVELSSEEVVSRYFHKAEENQRRIERGI